VLPNLRTLSAIGNFIPKCIINALSDKPITVCENKVREWIYVLDHCIALTKILFYGRTGEIYNISSGNEISDFDVAKKILGLVGKPDSAIGKHILRRIGQKFQIQIQNYFRKSLLLIP